MVSALHPGVQPFSNNENVKLHSGLMNEPVCRRSVHHRTMPNLGTDAKPQGPIAVALTKQPQEVLRAGTAPLNRRVLFHEAREALHSTQRQEQARQELSPEPTTTLQRKRHVVQAVLAGVRRTRWKQNFIEALQERSERKSQPGSEASSFAVAAPVKAEPAEPVSNEEASPEDDQPALVELGSTVDALVETFSRLQHLEDNFEDPVMKGSFAEVLKSAEHCTKLLCYLKSGSAGLVDDIMKLDEESANASLVASRLVEQLNADIARLHKTLQNEEESQEVSGNQQGGRRGRAKFLQAASHCLYALGILKDEASKPQRRFAVNAGAMEDGDMMGKLNSNSFSVAWEAAKRTRQAMFERCKSNRGKREGTEGDDSDSDSDSDEEEETSKGGWLERILAQLKKNGEGDADDSAPSEERPSTKSVGGAGDQDYSDSATASTTASCAGSRSIADTDTEYENAEQVENKIMKPPGSPSSPSGGWRAHRPHYTLEKASPKSRSGQNADAPAEISQVPSPSPLWRTIDQQQQQQQQPQQPEQNNGNLSSGLDGRCLGPNAAKEGGSRSRSYESRPSQGAAARSGRYLTRNYDTRRKTKGTVRVSVALLEDEDALLDEELNQLAGLIRAKSYAIGRGAVSPTEDGEGEPEPPLAGMPTRQRVPSDTPSSPRVVVSAEAPAVGSEKRPTPPTTRSYCRAKTMQLHLHGDDSDSDQDDRALVHKASSAEAKTQESAPRPLQKHRTVCSGIVMRSAHARAGLSSFAEAVNLNVNDAEGVGPFSRQITPVAVAEPSAPFSRQVTPQAPVERPPPFSRQTSPIVAADKAVVVDKSLALASQLSPQAPTSPRTPRQSSPRRLRPPMDLATLVGRKDGSKDTSSPAPAPNVANIRGLSLKHEAIIKGFQELEDDADGFIFPGPWARSVTQ